MTSNANLNLDEKEINQLSLAFSNSLKSIGLIVSMFDETRVCSVGTSELELLT